MTARAALIREVETYGISPESGASDAEIAALLADLRPLED